jgi:hypothetical protein
MDRHFWAWDGSPVFRLPLRRSVGDAADKQISKHPVPDLAVVLNLSF